MIWDYTIEDTSYGVATISRLLKNIGLFCKISFLWYGSFAKETYNFQEPTKRSHTIGTPCVSADMSKIRAYTCWGDGVNAGVFPHTL